MSEVKRFWVHWNDQLYVADKNGDLVMAEDFDRVTAERDALQVLLNKADQELDGAGAAYLNKNAECLALLERADVLEGLLRLLAELPGVRISGMWERVVAALKPAEAQKCQFPQSCPSNCGCDIPDFTPGNGNKARRRAAAIEALKPENQRITPIDHGIKAGFCDCNQGRLPCTCKASAYDGFDNGVD